jgi:hypothetical protein
MPERHAPRNGSGQLFLLPTLSRKDSRPLLFLLISAEKSWRRPLMLRASSTIMWVAKLGLFLSLSGCIGIGVATLGEESAPIDNPKIGNERSQVWSRMSNEPPLTSSLLFKQWGRPDRLVRNSDHTEEWVYWSTGSIWSGVELWALILPLPLAIPTGYVRVSFVVQDGQVVSAYRAWDRLEGKFFCGFLPTNVVFGGNAFVCGPVKWVTSG